MYINSELWSWKANPLIPFSVFHGLELSINSPGFSQASQWSTAFLPGVPPPPSEVLKPSRPGKKHARRRAESRNKSLGRAPLRPCQLAETCPSGGGCRCRAGWRSGFPSAEEMTLLVPRASETTPGGAERGDWSSPGPATPAPGADAGAPGPRGFPGHAAEAVDAPHPSPARERLRFAGARAGEQFRFDSASALYYVSTIPPPPRIGFTPSSLGELPDGQHSSKQ